MMKLRQLYENELTAAILAQRILAGTVKQEQGCVDEPEVMYDAIWHDTPYLINIAAKTAGKGLGLVAFLDFLAKVGQGQQFVSTDFTAAGQKLFARAAQAGPIRQLPLGPSLGNKTAREVIGDPETVLKRIADAQ